MSASRSVQLGDDASPSSEVQFVSGLHEMGGGDAVMDGRLLKQWCGTIPQGKC